MTDSMEQKAETIKADTARVAETQRSEIDTAAQVKFQWPDAWRAIAQAIDVDVHHFNAKFPNKHAQHITIEQRSDLSLFVRRDDGPHVRIIGVEAIPEMGVSLRLITTDHRTANRDVQDIRFPFGL